MQIFFRCIKRCLSSFKKTSTFNVPELTQEILDEGLVTVHINLNTTAGYELWSPLPVVIFDETLKVNQVRVREIDIRNNSSVLLVA